LILDRELPIGGSMTAGHSQNLDPSRENPALPDDTVQSTDLLDWSFGELEAFLVSHGHKPVHAESIWGALHRRWITEIAEMDGPDRVRRSLMESGSEICCPTVTRFEASRDGFTRKYLLRLDDGEVVETVLMRYKGRATACVSTQAGCAMGCVFCATGQSGFRRQLRAGEILGQVYHVARTLREEGDRLRNLVLMGQGEPLHNYDAVLQAVDRVIDGKGLALSPIRVTLSTVGLVPGIRRLADERRPMALAVSLHAATDAQRQALVPVARRWPLAELMEACRYFTEQTGRGIFFEWTLIEGQNDGPDQARELAEMLADQQAHVNLIPLNPTAGFGGEPTGLSRARAFQAILRDAGIVSTIRQRRGIDIDAGCGQLAARES
jgi:23S rRNA (adenine2503-C2)-methyltransferase